MRRRFWIYLGAAVGAFGLLGAANAQTTYRLGFQGPDSFVGAAGDTKTADYLCTLAQEPTDTVGAQGWSISVTADEATITAISLDDTDTLALFSGGFKVSQTTEASKVGSACEGKLGAVSAIVLSYTEPITLDPTKVSSIAKLSVETTIPAGGGTAVLRYADGCQGKGQPVENAITQAGATVKPELGRKEIALQEKVTCAGKPANLGFSAVRLRSADTAADPFGAVLGEEGSGGTIPVEVSIGATGTATVYVDIVSDVPAPEPPAEHVGPQGWSIAIGIEEGAAGVLTDASVAGTSAAPEPDGLWRGGFAKTELVNPDVVPASGPLAGQRQGPGAVSAIVLSLTEPVTLPPKGAESVLKLTVEQSAPQGDAVATVKLFNRDGLKGAGQPVSTVVTIAGATVSPCNTATADVTVAFGPSKAKKFVRGNANNDRKVDIADPIWIVNELFRQGPKSVCEDAADVDNSGTVDSSDVVYLINYLFKAGPTPAAPFPECGEDPEGDEDGVTCETSHDAC